MAKQRANELDRFKDVESSATDWERAMRLHAFADAVEAQARLVGELTSEYIGWLAWTRAKADWLTPMILVRKPIRDAPEQERPSYWSELLTRQSIKPMSIKHNPFGIQVISKFQAVTDS